MPAALAFPGTGWTLPKGSPVPTFFPNPVSNLTYGERVAQRQVLLGVPNLTIGQAARLYNLNRILGTPQPPRVLSILHPPAKAGGVTSTGHSSPAAIETGGPMVEISSGSGTGFGGIWVPAPAPVATLGMNGGHGGPPALTGVSSGGGYSGAPLSYGSTHAPINTDAGILHVNITDTSTPGPDYSHFAFTGSVGAPDFSTNQPVSVMGGASWLGTVSQGGVLGVHFWGDSGPQSGEVY